MPEPDRQVAEEVDTPQEPGQAQAPPPAVRWQDRDRDEMLLDLLERLGDGETLASLCALPEFPSKALIRVWKREDPELAARFAQAREEFWDSVAEDVIDICDGVHARKGGSVERDKLRAWGRTQLLARLDTHRAANKDKTPAKTIGRIVIVGVRPGEAVPAITHQPEEGHEPDAG